MAEEAADGSPEGGGPSGSAGPSGDAAAEDTPSVAEEPAAKRSRTETDGEKDPAGGSVFCPADCDDDGEDGAIAAGLAAVASANGAGDAADDAMATVVEVDAYGSELGASPLPQGSPAPAPLPEGSPGTAVVGDAYGGDLAEGDGVDAPPAAAVTASAAATAAPRRRRDVVLRRQIMGVLGMRGQLVAIDSDDDGDVDGDDDDGDGDGDGDGGADEDGEEEDNDDDDEDGDGDEDGDEDGNDEDLVVLGGAQDSESDVDVPAFREKIERGGPSAMALWRTSVFHGASLTGECALAVANWLKKGVITPSTLSDEMLLCVTRCLTRVCQMLEEEEDRVKVFNLAVELTEHAECLGAMLERGFLRAILCGLQATAHLILEGQEDQDWFESDSLVRIYKAFKTLWQTCQAKPETDAVRKQVTAIIFAALSKWLRGALDLARDGFIGEDDILVFWVLIPLWPTFLDHLEASQDPKSTEDRARFKEICNWVLWPNDPVVESCYRLIGHLDLEEGADFSLHWLISEDRFRWVVTPSTKQRYLQHRVERLAAARFPAAGDEEAAQNQPLVLVVHRETPLQDLCRQLGVSNYGNDRVNLLSGITVHFGTDTEGALSEEGVDEGGPWREAIPLAFSELISPSHGLFEVRDEGELRFVEPRWAAKSLVPDFGAQFELCGVLIGMALVYQAYAPAHFSRCFLKHLVGLPREPKDVPSLEEQLAAVASAGEAIEALCLTFSVDDATTGAHFEFRPGGGEESVTMANASDYARLRTDWELDGRFATVMPHVLLGLHRVIPPEVVEAFARMVSADELDTMLAGHGINIQDWRDNTEYEGYNSNADMVKWFWSAVDVFTAQEREDLWTFISGSKGVPPGGFGHLTNGAGESIRFTIAKVESSPKHMPVAHTCGYQLDLPAYESEEDLLTKLRLAMRHRQGFGLA